MSLTLYYSPRSSASPITWALAELGIEHEAIELDLKAGEQKKPEVLAHNPMGQVPTLVDDGQGMFESSAIIIHLGDKFGVERGLWPAADSPQRMQALSWMAWLATTLGSTLRMIMLNTGDWWPKDMQNDKQADKGRERLAELMGVLDQRLSTQPYMVGDDFTLVDAYGAAAIGWATGVVGFDLSTTPNIRVWLTRNMEREGAQNMR